MSADVSSNAVPMPTAAVNRKRLRVLAGYVRPHARECTLAVLTTLGITVCIALVPFFYRHAIDAGGIGAEAFGRALVGHRRAL